MAKLLFWKKPKDKVDEEFVRSRIVSARPKEVKYQSLALPKHIHISPRQTAFVPAIVLGKNLLEVLRPKATLVVVGHAVAAVLVLV